MVAPRRMVAQLLRLQLLLLLLASVSFSTNSQLQSDKSPINGSSSHYPSSENSSTHVEANLTFSDTTSSSDYSLPIIGAYISRAEEIKFATGDKSDTFSTKSNVRRSKKEHAPEQHLVEVSREESRGSNQRYKAHRLLFKGSPRKHLRTSPEVADAVTQEIFQLEQLQNLREAHGPRLHERTAVTTQRATLPLNPVFGGGSSAGGWNQDDVEQESGGRTALLWVENTYGTSDSDSEEQIPKTKAVVEATLKGLLLSLSTSSVTVLTGEKVTLRPESNFDYGLKKSVTKDSPAPPVLSPKLKTKAALRLASVSFDDSVQIPKRLSKVRDNFRSVAVPSHSPLDRNAPERGDEDKLPSREEKPKGSSGNDQILTEFPDFQTPNACLHCKNKHSRNHIQDANEGERNGTLNGSYLDGNSAHINHSSFFVSLTNITGIEDEPIASKPFDSYRISNNSNTIKSKRKRRNSRLRRESNDGSDDSDDFTSAANSIRFQTEEEDEDDRSFSSGTNGPSSSDTTGSQNVSNKTTSAPEGGDTGPKNEEELLIHDRNKLMVLLAQLESECLKMITLDELDHLGCKRVWDKALCWPPTGPGKSATQPCPTHIPGMANDGVAKRWCDSQGRWGQKPQKPATSNSGVQSTTATAGSTNTTGTTGAESGVAGNRTGTVAGSGGAGGSGTNAEPLSVRGSNETTPINVTLINSAGWTDYSQCLHSIKHDEEEGLSLMKAWLPFVKRCSLVGYSISLTTLLVSFVILASLKKLRCPRNLLHLHLFASFILRAVVVLLRSSLLASSLLTPTPTHAPQPTQINESDSWWCRLVIAIWQYFITANYSWILMEGLYLHNLIFRALFTDSSAITLYVLLGWGLPLVLVTAWACVRLVVDNSHCWMVHNKPWVFMVLIRIPVAFSVFLNFFFFVNVVRVLTLKLRSSVSDESMKYRKLAKSTLVLVPLFGAHYCLLWGLSTSTHPTVELAWLLVDQVFASFQGFFVAVLYCLINGEVRQELRKIYYNRFGGGNHVPFATGQSTVMSHTRVYTSWCKKGLCKAIQDLCGRTTRASLHSIQSLTERRERQSPSPKLTVGGSEERGGGEPPLRFTPSPDTQKMAGFNSVTEEMIELHPRNPSSDPLGKSPDGRRKMTACDEGAHQDELQQLIPKSQPGAELRNSLHFSQPGDQTSTGNCLSASTNIGLETGMVKENPTTMEDGGNKPSNVDNNSWNTGSSIPVSKAITRNGNIGSVISKDRISKLEDTGFSGNDVEDSMTVNLMIGTGEVGMKKMSVVAFDEEKEKGNVNSDLLHGDNLLPNTKRDDSFSNRQSPVDGGDHKPLINFDEVSAPIVNERKGTSNSSFNTDVEIGSGIGRSDDGNVQAKTVTEKGLKVDYTNDIKGSKVSTSLLNPSSQDDCKEDSKLISRNKEKSHETML